MTALIHCRAKVSASCEDGHEWDVEVSPDQSEDGTYLSSDDDPRDPERGTIVCNACYLFLMPFTPSGAALNPELPDAIEAAQTTVALIKSADEQQLNEYMEDADKAMTQESFAGSPRYRSAQNFRALAEAEMIRRQEADRD